MKIILTICLLLILSGCTEYIEPTKVGIAEFEVGGETVTVGGERLLGGDTIQDFKPEIKLNKWGDETHIRVWSEETGDANATQVGNKVVWENTDKSKEYNFYPVEDGFEYEIILKEKPKTNIIELKIETQDLEFYYQPELTQKEIDEGHFRPENVVGSYAVYHSSKQGNYEALGGKNYMVGKAFHIYRPQMEDADGWRVWGELHIENGIMSVTIPQDFLDKATYPIRHATGATFGYTSDGNTNITISDASNQAIRGASFTLGEAANVSSLSIRFYRHERSDKTVGAIYDNSLNLELASSEVTTDASTDASWEYVWRTHTLLTSLSSGDYYLVTNALYGGTYAVSARYDNVTSVTYAYNSTAYTTSFPDPFGGSTGTANTRYSIYATYTAGAPEYGVYPLGNITNHVK